MKRKHKATFTRADERTGLPMLVYVESAVPITNVSDNSGKKWKRLGRKRAAFR
jgi:hypothetical protein